MNLHLLYSWINLWGSNPPYRNNLYIIPYVINLKKIILKSNEPPPPYLSTANSRGVETPPPTPYFSAPVGQAYLKLLAVRRRWLFLLIYLQEAMYNKSVDENTTNQ